MELWKDCCSVFLSAKTDNELFVYLFADNWVITIQEPICFRRFRRWAHMPRISMISFCRDLVGLVFLFLNTEKIQTCVCLSKYISPFAL